ncbi:solute carrier organic anion transporter family member 1C1 [Aplysia californica]|uniref:Solute carrier organic anion transporter family member 1C1 n=1 Tax=Aplysia californica TaxID=6500 RepID=A0ABM1ADF3_APLCA|nr:solute carrier organic anion transporter family member 1C1 [Aplysia californica]
MSSFSGELDRSRQEMADFQQERERQRREQLEEVRELGQRLGQVASELRRLLEHRRHLPVFSDDDDDDDEEDGDLGGGKPLLRSSQHLPIKPHSADHSRATERSATPGQTATSSDVRETAERNGTNPFEDRTPDGGGGQNQPLLCGLYGWRPHWLQPFANLYMFATLVGLSYFFTGMARLSLRGQLVSIERQFNIDSSRSGLFTSAALFGHTCSVLLVGHFARSTNIPLAIGIAGILSGVFTMMPSVLELASPYKLAPIDTYTTMNTDHPHRNEQYICKLSTTEDLSTAVSPASLLPNSSLAETLESDLERSNKQSNILAYYILLVSLFLQGLVNSFRYGALPFVYVDDNVLDKTRTGVFIAISYVLAELTEPVGDVVNSLLSSIPVDLSRTSMKQDDPRFISAWWLSFLVFGILTIIVSVPITFLPRYLLPRDIQQKSLENAMVTFAVGEKAKPCLPSSSDEILYSQLSEEEDSPNSDAVDMTLTESRPSRHQVKDLTCMQMIKDLPRSVYRIFSSPLFALLAIEITIIYVPLLGVRPFSIKYIMFEYNVSMARTNFARGMSSAITHILGTAISSYLSTRIKTRLGYLKLILFTSVITWMMTPFYIVFGCDNGPIYGLSGQFGMSVDNSTASTCHCDPSLNLLSCGTDGHTYLSPCYAGCTDSNGTVFFNCSGFNVHNSSSQAEPGVCDVGCERNFILYNILQASQTFIFSMNNMPRHLLALRILYPEDRAFGNAFMHFAPFLASIPAPLLFGKWIESMCVVWSSDHCSLYNRDSIRYLTGGVEIIVCGLTVVTYLAMVFVCRWLDKKEMLKLRREQ